MARLRRGILLMLSLFPIGGWAQCTSCPTPVSCQGSTCFAACFSQIPEVQTGSCLSGNNAAHCHCQELAWKCAAACSGCYTLASCQTAQSQWAQQSPASNCQLHCPSGGNGSPSAPVAAGGGTCNPATTCSGHGTCTAAGTCACFNDAQNGRWATANCGTCQAGWALPTCAIPSNGQPPTPRGGVVVGPTTCFASTTCRGRGICTPTGSCACFGDPLRGFFRGTNCEQCGFGYEGVLCNVPTDTNQNRDDDSSTGSGSTVWTVAVLTGVLFLLGLMGSGLGLLALMLKRGGRQRPPEYSLQPGPLETAGPPVLLTPNGAPPLVFAPPLVSTSPKRLPPPLPLLEYG